MIKPHLQAIFSREKSAGERIFNVLQSVRGESPKTILTKTRNWHGNSLAPGPAREQTKARPLDQSAGRSNSL
ncbi:MAG TPA: hypothetical protein VMU22_11785 [Rhizomicrobium sp.]|nr:hypothetical protein [Rhizomicrobium sp.]